MPNDSATAAMRRGDWNSSVMPRLCHARGSRAKWLVEETKPLLKSQGSPTSHRGIEFNPVFCSGETFPAHPLVRNRYKKLNSFNSLGGTVILPSTSSTKTAALVWCWC